MRQPPPEPSCAQGSRARLRSVRPRRGGKGAGAGIAAPAAAGRLRERKGEGWAGRSVLPAGREQTAPAPSQGHRAERCLCQPLQENSVPQREGLKAKGPQHQLREAASPHSELLPQGRCVKGLQRVTQRLILLFLRRSAELRAGGAEPGWATGSWNPGWEVLKPLALDLQGSAAEAC